MRPRLALWMIVCCIALPTQSRAQDAGVVDEASTGDDADASGAAANAEDGSTPTPDPTTMMERVTAAYEQAMTAFNEGRYPEAEALFTEGYELSGRPGFLWNMAESARLQGDHERARDLYHRYLDESPDGARREATLERLAMLPAPIGESPDPDSTSGVALNEQPTNVDQPTRKRIYKKWWFWTLTAAAVGGGITAVVLTQRNKGGAPAATNIPDGTLPPITVTWP